jgi:transcriptional regulator with XRE-family HTH domain
VAKTKATEQQVPILFYVVIPRSLPQYRETFSKAGARMPKTSNKSATKSDKLIGEKIRARRLKMGLTQEALAAKLGVTFQQIQKYEKGINRVGSGRLYEIAEHLEAPVASFFESEAKPKTSFNERGLVQAGGLMSYGPSYSDLFRRAAEIVDKILRGTKPGDIPVEQPTQFDLVVNLKTAKALAITIPSRLLAIADEVIE